MSSEIGNIDAVVGKNVDGRGRSTPRRDGVQNGDGLISFKLGETGAANDADVDGL